MIFFECWIKFQNDIQKHSSKICEDDLIKRLGNIMKTCIKSLDMIIVITNDIKCNEFILIYIWECVIIYMTLYHVRANIKNIS